MFPGRNINVLDYELLLWSHWGYYTVHILYYLYEIWKILRSKTHLSTQEFFLSERESVCVCVCMCMCVRKRIHMHNTYIKISGMIHQQWLSLWERIEYGGTGRSLCFICISISNNNYNKTTAFFNERGQSRIWRFYFI